MCQEANLKPTDDSGEKEVCESCLLSHKTSFMFRANREVRVNCNASLSSWRYWEVNETRLLAMGVSLPGHSLLWCSRAALICFQSAYVDRSFVLIQRFDFAGGIWHCSSFD